MTVSVCSVKTVTDIEEIYLPCEQSLLLPFAQEGKGKVKEEKKVKEGKKVKEHSARRVRYTITNVRIRARDLEEKTKKSRKVAEN